MIETVAGSYELRAGERPRDAWEWTSQNVPGGVRSWSMPRSMMLPGVSFVRLAESPDGVRRLMFEGNLTTVLHGEGSACGSLLPGEVPEARDRLLGRVSALTGIDVSDPKAVRLSRLDPSRTFALREGVSAEEVLAGVRQSFSVLSGGRAVLRNHRGEGETVTLSHTKGRSWSVYDKAAEYRQAGYWTPAPEMVRLEARVRPGKVRSGHWKGLAATFELGDDVMDAARSEMDDLMDALGRVSAVAALSVVRALMRGGATPNQALRLASVTQLVELGGWGILDQLGVSAETARRWRSEVRKFMTASGGEEAFAEDGAETIRSVLGQEVHAGDVAAALAAFEARQEAPDDE